MAPLLGKEDSKEIVDLFSARLLGGVSILLFTKNNGCARCPETSELLEEVVSLDRRLKLQTVEIESDPGLAVKLGVDTAPTTVIVATNGAIMHYVGMPGGRQLRPLIEDLVDASRGRSEFDRDTAEILAGVKKPTSIKVFVTPACQLSPLVVRSAHKFALANPLIRAWMVEILEFPEVAERYGVIGVPRTIINEGFAFDGWPGERAFAEKVLETSGRA